VAAPATKQAPRSRLRLRVNPIRCAAFGFCAEYAPELFGLDDWGYAWLQSREVPVDLESLAWEAAALCPTRAILLDAPPSPATPAAALRSDHQPQSAERKD
jgi:ferredoxin